MKTPHAILIGLSLIAAAIFFKEPIKTADANPREITKVQICDSDGVWCARITPGKRLDVRLHPDDVR
tara:strand:- start:111 stop:311 length:201 start_codon:yes stop_codon:yes gene_type:complete